MAQTDFTSPLHSGSFCGKPTVHRLSCATCGGPFFHTDQAVGYCSVSCAEKDDGPKAANVLRTASRRRDKLERAIEIGNRHGMETEFWMASEDEFASWFKLHYWLFGLRRIIAISEAFPDVLAETVCGQRLRVELEYHASNFANHGHDPGGADIIFAYAKSSRNTVRGLPVLALFELPIASNKRMYDFTDLKPTPFFRELKLKTEAHALEYIASVALNEVIS